jgi:rhomboid protease GluP
MESTDTSIPAASQHQAMEWSLVLVSQEIETTIASDSEGGGWRLVISAADLERAMEALRRYRAENQGAIWRRELPWTGLIFDWRCLAWLGLFVFLYFAEATRHGEFKAVGIMNGVSVRQGEWWRLLTAITLHADLAHLAANVGTGLVLLGLSMGVFGPGLGVLGSLFGGIVGNLAGFAVYPEIYRGLGASGMVMGSLGMLTAQSLALVRHGLTPRQLAIRAVLSGCLLLVLLGFSPERNTDVLAHVAGFAGGALAGAAMGFLPLNLRRNGWLNRSVQWLCFLVVAGTWWLALRHGKPI